MQLPEKSRIILLRIHPPTTATDIQIQSIELPDSRGETSTLRFDSN